MMNKLPLYKQLNDALKKLIKEENYSTGDRFITERTICADYGVSRATANKALSSLVSEGLLEFRIGVGTFIKSKPSERDEFPTISELQKNNTVSQVSLTSEIIRSELLGSNELDDHIIKLLKVNSEEYIYRIEIIQRDNGIPIMLEYHYIAEKYCPDLLNCSLKGSLFSLLREKYELDINRLEEKVHAEKLNKLEAEILRTDSGKAVFSLMTTAFILNQRPFWWKKTIFKPDEFEILFSTEKNLDKYEQTGKIIQLHHEQFL